MPVRIIAGKFKGFSLIVPAYARPTLSRFRQSLFDILESTEKEGFFTGKVVLDCFAGSGSFGFEAISRGASYVYFVDSSRKASSVIDSNINKLGVGHLAKTINSDVTLIKNRNNFAVESAIAEVTATTMEGAGAADIVFLDPPYGKVSIRKTLKHLLSNDWISENTIIITEESAKNTEVLDDLEFFDNLDGFNKLGKFNEITSRTYGNSLFRIGKIAKICK